jgi:D-xylose transport system substrate-binding protein
MVFKKHILIGVAGIALSATGALAQAKGPVVGVSWSNFQEERWKTDEAAIKAVVEAAGDKYVSVDAQGSAAKQATDIEQLITQGADVLIVLAQDSATIDAAIQPAIDANIPVIGYDRLIENPAAFYITFDNVEVGRMQAAAVLAAAPKGTYAVIKGDPGDPNADFLRSGIEEVLAPAIAAGDVTICEGCEVYTDGWKPENAQTEMEQILTAQDNKIDAVVAENDGMAGGAFAALSAQGLTVPLSGQDGDHAALNRVALGQQTVSVWKDSRALGSAAATAALELAANPDLAAVTGAQVFSSGPKAVDMESILLAPVPVTKDNLEAVIDAGWITKDEVCAGVAAGSVAACN